MPAHLSHDDDLHDGGLRVDLPRMVSRRRLLGLLGGAGGALILVACGGSDDTSSATAAAGDTSGAAATTSATTAGTETSAAASTTAATAAGAASTVCEVIPSETGGPYPGDGSNGPNVLVESGVVRSDITTSFGSMSGTATGVPLTVTLAINDSSTCAPLAGAAVYLWHADAEGRYSLYSDGVTDQNYLRGVQETDANGTVTFTTIFPGCYDGRWPHMHFEVYSSLADATSTTGLIRTSQLALPEDACNFAYAASGYETSISNLSRQSLTSDNVFSDDGAVHQLATAAGSIEEGFVASLDLAI